MSGLSTHVLDTSLGRPAAGIRVRLERMQPNGEWQQLSERTTDIDGRCPGLLPQLPLMPGQYKLCFDTAAYHASLSVTGLYATVEIIVTVRAGDTHLHIPLLLSPNGYTTYRGS